MNVTLQWESSTLRIGPFPHEGEADPEPIDAGAMVSAKGLSADGMDEGGLTLDHLHGHGGQFYERSNGYLRCRLLQPYHTAAARVSLSH